ncbi:hypothetical protein GF382_00115 [Candidatus Falkowbacteria bacterium]|nr:hypothetical protein [Candidatus Falkowbacteria bacterium]
MAEKKHLGTITILVKDRQKASVDLQKILTEAGHMIMARLGVNPQRACIEHCTGLVVLVVEGNARDISALAKKIDRIYGIVAKKIMITK